MTEEEKIKTTIMDNLSRLYICGKIKKNHVPNELWFNVLPKWKNCFDLNCDRKLIDINKKKGTSFRTNPKIRKKPKSSGNKFELGGLSNWKKK